MDITPLWCQEFSVREMSLGNNSIWTGPESARADFQDSGRIRGGGLEATLHDVSVAPARFHLSIWNPAGDP